MHGGEGHVEAATPYCYEYPRPAVTVDLAAFASSAPTSGCCSSAASTSRSQGAGRCRVVSSRSTSPSRPQRGAAARGDRVRRAGSSRVDRRLRRTGTRPARTHDQPGACSGRATPSRECGRGRRRGGSGLVRSPASGNMAFDHDAILAAALAWLSRGVVEGGLGLGLLPLTFSAGEVRRLLECSACRERPRPPGSSVCGGPGGSARPVPARAATSPTSIEPDFLQAERSASQRISKPMPWSAWLACSMLSMCMATAQRPRG